MLINFSCTYSPPLYVHFIVRSRFNFFSLHSVLAADTGKVVCYFGSWAVWRPGDGKFDVEDIDPFLCTHAIFGFAGLSNHTWEIEVGYRPSSVAWLVSYLTAFCAFVFIRISRLLQFHSYVLHIFIYSCGNSSRAFLKDETEKKANRCFHYK